MKCPRCGARTRVTNSRSPSERSDSRQSYLISRADEVIGWWCRDYRVRARECQSCDWREVTLELTVDDLYEAFADLGIELGATGPHEKLAATVD